MQKFSPQKVLVVDDRIASSYKQEYALNVGPESSRINFTTPSSNSANQLQFVMQNADITTRVDSHCYVQLDSLLSFVDVAIANPSGGAGIAANTPILTIGKQIGPKAFPLMGRCVNNSSTVMANETFTLSNADVQQFIFRMMDTDKLYQERTCPSSLDRFINYADANNTVTGMNVLGAYFDSGANRINNSSYGFVYTDVKGSILSADTASMYAGGAVPAGFNDYKYVSAANQVQVSANIAAGPNPNSVAVFRVYLAQLNLCEPVICNPWSWDEPVDLHKSFHDIQNATITLNMNPNPVLFGQIDPTIFITNQGLNPYVSTPFSNPQLINYFYALPLTVQDNMPCVRPYLEFERTNAVGNSVVASGASASLTSPVIPLGGVSDMFLIGVLPTAYNNNNSAVVVANGNNYVESDWFLTINNVSLTWGTKENLMASFTNRELYKICYKNGLKMNALEFSGSVNAIEAGNNMASVPTVSSFIVIKPALDFDIGDLVSGMPVNKNFQVKVNFTNQSNWPVTPQLRVICVNSCYAIFENAKCTIEKFPVRADDLYDTNIPKILHSSIKRMVGAGVYKNSSNNQMLKYNKQSNKHPHHVGSGSHSGGALKSHSKKHSKKTAKSRARK